MYKQNRGRKNELQKDKAKNKSESWENMDNYIHDINFFVGTVPCVAKAKAKVNFNKRNMLYVQILNYAMPTVKAISFNEEDMAENKFSFKNLVLQMIGLNIHNPISLVEKEMPVLCLNSSKEDTKDKSMALDPFKLEEKEVSKYKAEEMKDGKEDLNLENKVVNVQEPKLKRN